MGSPVEGIQDQVDKLFVDKELMNIRVKDYMKKHVQKDFKNAKNYIDNDVALEKIDPHAVYPTSIYRNCDGFTLATPDS